MSEERTSESVARARLADGEAFLQEELFQDAMKSFTEAQALFESAGDDIGALEALSKLISVYTAQGDWQVALTMAQEKKVQFEAKWSITGEICMLEQIINAHAANLDAVAAEKTARKAIEHFRQYDACGMDTTAGQAFMWLTIAKACLTKGENEDAMEAAEMATQMFSDLGEYEHESLAVKIYSAAHDQKGKDTYLLAEKQSFYLGVRLSGIAYGPKYRDNNIICVKPTGSAHVACVLQLTCEEAEGWEHEVGFHAGLIDAGGHAGFANGIRPDARAAAAEAIADPNFVPEGPRIPFLMDHGELRPRPNASDMYVNIAAGQVYLFNH